MTVQVSKKFCELKESGIYKDFRDNYYYLDVELKRGWLLTPQVRYSTELQSQWFSRVENDQVKIGLPQPPQTFYPNCCDD